MFQILWSFFLVFVCGSSQMSTTTTTTSDFKFKICDVAVLWDVNYDLFFKYRLKFESMLDTCPDFFDAHFVVTSSKNEKLLKWFEENNIIVVHAERTTRFMSGDNYKYFLTKLKLFDDRIIDKCEVMLYSDADTYLMNQGFQGILEECPEEVDVCMTSQSRNVCSGTDCCRYSPIMVANSGVMVLRNPKKVRKALFKILDDPDEDTFRRDQHLFGHILCDTNLINLHTLNDKWNSNFNFDEIEDIRLVHYSAGPDFMNPQVIPISTSVFQSENLFGVYGNLSQIVDPCYSQYGRCTNVENKKCGTASNDGPCLDTQLAELAPYVKEEKNVAGFDFFVCALQKFPDEVFDLFLTCSLTCDLFPLLEEKCFTTSTFSFYLCGQYFSSWIYDTFVEKTHLISLSFPLCGCCTTIFEKVMCAVGFLFLIIFLFLRLFFLPVLIFTILFVWYFKSSYKASGKKV